MPFRHPAAIVLAATLAVLSIAGGSAHAQFRGRGGPPSVGVVRAETQPITETSEFVGRIAAVNRVALVARVTAFLEQSHGAHRRSFT